MSINLRSVVQVCFFSQVECFTGIYVLDSSFYSMYNSPQLTQQLKNREDPGRIQYTERSHAINLSVLDTESPRSSSTLLSEWNFQPDSTDVLFINIKATATTVAVGAQEAKHVEGWPNTTSAWAGWTRFDIPVDRYGGVHSLLVFTSSTLEPPSCH